MASDVFRNDGFLVSADPKALAVPGCDTAQSAAVVEDASGKFLTSSTADDATKCHEVPLLIDFLQDTPAGAVQVTPLVPNSLTMEVTFRDLSRGTSATLTVPPDISAAHGGVDQLLIRALGGGPVAVTKLKVAPLT
ncbi:hypothetical protein [Paractinoplanes durhamensis]|uniref:hypothetical protein n=1 Tax=Paractinoplanes durhamensis TaxID=113563 RepID=UPI003645026E